MRTLRRPVGRRLLVSTMGIVLAVVGALGAVGPVGAQVLDHPPAHGLHLGDEIGAPGRARGQRTYSRRGP